MSQEKEEAKVVNNEESGVETKSEEPKKVKSKAKVKKVKTPAQKTKKKKDKTKKGSTLKETLSAEEAAALAEAEAAAAVERSAAARSAAEQAAEEEYKAAAAEAVAPTTGDSFTNKRGQERIFRREMGEPEFFQHKKDLLPIKPVRTKEEEAEISRRAQIPVDNTPQYKPENILSPEYAGVSNYEVGIDLIREEKEKEVERLRKDPESSPQKIKLAEQDLKKLDYLHENYYEGMNVFRTAKGGRSKLRE